MYTNNYSQTRHGSSSQRRPDNRIPDHRRPDTRRPDHRRPDHRIPDHRRPYYPPYNPVYPPYNPGYPPYNPVYPPYNPQPPYSQQILSSYVFIISNNIDITPYIYAYNGTIAYADSGVFIVNGINAQTAAGIANTLSRTYPYATISYGLYNNKLVYDRNMILGIPVGINMI